MNEIVSEQNAKALYAMGYQAYERGQYREGINFFRVLTSLESHIQKHWIGLAACHQMLKQYDEALPAYSVAAVINEENPEVHMHAAECLFELGRYDEAQNALMSARHFAEKKPQYIHLLPELALIRAKWNNVCTVRN